MDTLSQLASEGFAADDLEASLNTIEFSLEGVQHGLVPQGADAASSHDRVRVHTRLAVASMASTRTRCLFAVDGAADAAVPWRRPTSRRRRDASCLDGVDVAGTSDAPRERNWESHGRTSPAGVAPAQGLSFMLGMDAELDL